VLVHRRPMLLLAVVVVAAVTMAALVTEGRETHVVVGGAALDRLVEWLLVTLPGPGSGGYDQPRRDQADALARAYAAARSGDAARAALLAAPLGYGVRRLGEGDALALALAPRPRADDEPGHGWGLFVHAPAAPADLVVEVVHPRADVRTALLGLLAFRATEAGDLLIAGAHRAANADGSQCRNRREDGPPPQRRRHVHGAQHMACAERSAAIDVQSRRVERKLLA